MKRFLMLAAIAFCAVAAIADEAQKLPAFGNMKKLAVALEDVTALQVVENPNHTGVVATYKRSCQGVGNTNRGYGSGKMNDTFERVFITGLDHDIITTRGMVYHNVQNGEHILCVWPIGIEKMTANGNPVRLKKFTVDPKQAAAYYKAKGKIK